MINRKECISYSRLYCFRIDSLVDRVSFLTNKMKAIDENLDELRVDMKKILEHYQQ